VCAWTKALKALTVYCTRSSTVSHFYIPICVYCRTLPLILLDHPPQWRSFVGIPDACVAAQHAHVLLRANAHMFATMVTICSHKSLLLSKVVCPCDAHSCCTCVNILNTLPCKCSKAEKACLQPQFIPITDSKHDRNFAACHRNQNR